MEKILNNHLGCIKSCKIMGYSIYHINWCRIASINSIKNPPHPWDWYIYCNCKFTIEINQMLSNIYSTLDGILYSQHVQFFISTSPSWITSSGMGVKNPATCLHHSRRRRCSRSSWCRWQRIKSFRNGWTHWHVLSLGQRRVWQNERLGCQIGR